MFRIFIRIDVILYGRVGVLVRKSNSKSKSKYTENWVPVKSISNGIITLDNNTYVTGVKIQPRNIFILDVSFQEHILFNLKNFYNSIDFEFSLICIDRPVDISMYLSQLQVLYNSSNDPMTKKMIIEDIDNANLFMNDNVVDTEYYLVFKEKNANVMQKRIKKIISGLATCNLSAAQINNDELRLILDSILNGGVSTPFNEVIPR
jgi:hypothetical protein